MCSQAALKMVNLINPRQILSMHNQRFESSDATGQHIFALDVTFRFGWGRCYLEFSGRVIALRCRGFVGRDLHKGLVAKRRMRTLGIVATP